MPIAKFKGYVIEHKWDDGSVDDVVVEAGEFSDTGQYVRVKAASDSLYIRPEDWPLIRESVDKLFESMDMDAESRSPKEPSHD